MEPQQGDAGREAAELAAKVVELKTQLKKYGEEHKLRGLEGRAQRGLDPAAQWAVKETADKLTQIAEALGADPEAVKKLTDELHVGAIWGHANEFKSGTDPAIQTWMVSAGAMERGPETDLSEGQFIENVEAVSRNLDTAVADPRAAFATAQETLVNSAQGRFEVRDGVPIATDPNGEFLDFAVNGHTAGIVPDKDGLLFVGADQIDFDSLSQLGLTKTVKEDRGRQATFFVDANGLDVVKQLYPGFGIVFPVERAEEIAKHLAKTGMQNAESTKIGSSEKI
ncbi:MAG: hypothetical protein WC862_02845 [Patescibacteria group bacterium]